MSTTGSQFKSFLFNVSPTEHASCRRVPVPGAAMTNYRSLPIFPRISPAESPQNPPSGGTRTGGAARKSRGLHVLSIVSCRVIGVRDLENVADTPAKRYRDRIDAGERRSIPVQLHQAEEVGCDVVESLAAVVLGNFQRLRDAKTGIAPQERYVPDGVHEPLLLSEVDGGAAQCWLVPWP